MIGDTYHVVDGCRQAIRGFPSVRRIAPIISEIDSVGVFWQKMIYN